LDQTVTCGGNCPSASCPDCICGTAKHTTSLTTACKGYGWEQTCCKCIGELTSKGNYNYMDYYLGYYSIGLIPVDEVSMNKFRMTVFWIAI